MSVTSMIRRIAATAAPDHADLPKTRIPAWPLIPGLLVAAASLIAYVQFLRFYPIHGLDFQMYRGGLQAFLHDQPVYRLGYTNLHLPYTYPPITLIILLPLTWIGSTTTALYCMDAVGMVAMVAVLWLTTRMLGYRGVAGRLGLVGAVAALMLWTEPYQENFSLGQVNVLVMLPVVIDLALPDRSRFKGIGIGLATASKLLPGLFVVYLLLTRRIRAAVTAVGTFVVLTAIGWAIEPDGSYDYWIKGLAFDSHRVLMVFNPQFQGNQSLQGFVARLFNIQQQNTLPWMAVAAVAAVAGLALAVAAQRRGEETMGMLIVGFTALLISPVSWSHYWLWIGPMVLVLADVARRSRGRAQVVAAGIATAAVLPFLVWPVRASGSQFLNGLIWAGTEQHGMVKRIFIDPYVSIALALFVLAWFWLRARSHPLAPTRPAGLPASATGATGAADTARRAEPETIAPDRPPGGRNGAAGSAGHEPAGQEDVPALVPDRAAEARDA